MFDWLRKKRLTQEEEERIEDEWYEKKSALMERILGKEHDMVMHAIIPYEIGGSLDLHYYPNSVKVDKLSIRREHGSGHDIAQRRHMHG